MDWRYQQRLEALYREYGYEPESNPIAPRKGIWHTGIPGPDQKLWNNGCHAIATGGINWTWYVFAHFHSDGTCTVVRHDRFHNERDEHPDSGFNGETVENPARQLTEVYVHSACCDHIYRFTVRNPKHVFEYSK